MGFQEDLKRQFGLDPASYKANLSKEELFHEALENDRGCIREGGSDDEHKAYATKLGVDGPLVYYTDPTCTGRPVKDTFAVAWPEFEDKICGSRTSSASTRTSSARCSSASSHT
jgi:phosphoenolpyruvate carboxykinase (ATP)